MNKATQPVDINKIELIQTNVEQIIVLCCIMIKYPVLHPVTLTVTEIFSRQWVLIFAETVSLGWKMSHLLSYFQNTC